MGFNSCHQRSAVIRGSFAILQTGNPADGTVRGSVEATTKRPQANFVRSRFPRRHPGDRNDRATSVEFISISGSAYPIQGGAGSRQRSCALYRLVYRKANSNTKDDHRARTGRFRARCARDRFSARLEMGRT